MCKRECGNLVIYINNCMEIIKLNFGFECIRLILYKFIVICITKIKDGKQKLYKLFIKLN